MINDIEPTVIKNILDSKAEAFKFYGNIRDVINKTDGRKVRFFNTAFDKVYRDGGLFAKSITGLKECFENSICAYSEKDNRGGVQRWGGSVHKTHPNIDFYHNYIGKVSIHEKECFVRFTVQEEKSGGNGVHSFFVSEVELYEKGQDTQTRLPLTRQKNGQPALTDAKLQKFLEEAKDAAENASKVVDENGEPRVIDGLYLNIKERNHITRLDISINKANNYVNKISEIENETGMEWDNESIFYQEEKAYNLLESIVSQKDYIEILINSIRKGIIPSIVVAYRYGDINERERSYNYRDQIFEQGISVVGRVSELNTNIDKYYELFYGEQPYNIVVGVYSGNRGADGEILLTPATKLGLVENLGNIIKSATDNTGSFSSENADIRFRMDNDLEAVNKRFNEELERYQQGKMSKNEMFHLGLPNGVMSIFLPNLPIVMRQRVVNKGANKKHNVEVSSIINMPQKISEPIFVFKKDDKSLSILSEMKDKIGRNVFVAFDLSSEIQDGGRYIEVNDVTTVHGRRIENIIRPINENNSLQWVDKKKALEWFSSASPNVQQEITSQELKTASNIIKNFENPNPETEKNTEDIRFRLDTPEEQQVIIAAQADGTWMKAPNGKPTNLTERQWVQVRTKAFKGIEKQRKSKPLVVSGNDYQGKYELNPKSATRYVLDNLRGNYVNLDTGETIRISRKGAEKVMKHDAESEAHLKSAAYIPQMIGNAVFITEEANTKEKTGFDSYRYYVLGLRMGSVDYTAKLVVGVKDGEAYYDHALTEIEKNSLLESIDPINTGFANKEDAVSAVKDKRLLSLLQTNSSKVVDENGEPRVVYHGTNESFLSFDRNKAGISRNTCERQGRIGRNIWQKFFPERIRDSQKADGGKNGRINNLENKKSYSHRRKSYKNDAYFGFEQNFQHQR